MDHPVASSQRLLGSGDLMVDQLVAASAAAHVPAKEGRERSLEAFDFSMSAPVPAAPPAKAPAKPAKKCVLAC